MIQTVMFHANTLSAGSVFRSDRKRKDFTVLRPLSVA